MERLGIAERSIYGYRLRRYLDQANVDELTFIRAHMCAALKQAYETVHADYVIVDLKIPRGDDPSPAAKGIEDPREPGDEPDESPLRVHVGDGAKEERQRILAEALAWGCTWAQEEHLRRGGALPSGRELQRPR